MIQEPPEAHHLLVGLAERRLDATSTTPPPATCSTKNIPQKAKGLELQPMTFAAPKARAKISGNTKKVPNSSLSGCRL